MQTDQFLKRFIWNTGQWTKSKIPVIPNVSAFSRLKEGQNDVENSDVI
jgi:hypothetical protein